MEMEAAVLCCCFWRMIVDTVVVVVVGGGGGSSTASVEPALSICVGVSRQMWGGVFGSHKKRYTHSMVETGEVERYVSHTLYIYIIQ